MEVHWESNDKTEYKVYDSKRDDAPTKVEKEGKDHNLSLAGPSYSAIDAVAWVIGKDTEKLKKEAKQLYNSEYDSVLNNINFSKRVSALRDLRLMAWQI